MADDDEGSDREAEADESSFESRRVHCVDFPLRSTPSRTMNAPRRMLGGGMAAMGSKLLRRARGRMIHSEGKGRLGAGKTNLNPSQDQGHMNVWDPGSLLPRVEARKPQGTTWGFARKRSSGWGLKGLEREMGSE